MNYDTIVVGSGAAGAILAARLTEDPQRSLLLLEAGPDFPHIDALPEEIRYAYGRDNLWTRAFGQSTKYGWGYTAKATATSDPMFVPRGKVVGGSSAINANIFLRGVPEDYDGWAAAGNDRWSFEELLPFFCKIEDDRDFSGPYHGNSGPIPAWRFPQEEWLPEHAAFYEVCRDAGYPHCDDHNAPDSTGVGPMALNNVDGYRWSTSIGYLDPARSRPNLTIQADSLVHRILFEGRRAVGVLVEHRGQLTPLYADEIIVSGGAIESPHLLLLSGIGPARDLGRMGVEVLHDMPGVGQNLRDHSMVLPVLRTRPGVPIDPLAPRIQVGLRYTASGSTWRNDMFLLSSSLATVAGVTVEAPPIGFYLAPCIYLAAGAGHLSLASTDPHVQPALDYNYLADPFDLMRLREGMHITLDMLEHPAFQEIVAERVYPSDADIVSDAALDAWILRNATTSHHSSSTCKMGPASDPMAVVDQYGKVHGLEGLRVADASIMPDCIRANTNVTTMVIGERVADFIRQGL
jgi:choline dehydrogenase